MIGVAKYLFTLSTDRKGFGFEKIQFALIGYLDQRAAKRAFNPMNSAATIEQKASPSRR